MSFKYCKNKRKKVFIEVLKRIKLSPSIGLCMLIPQIIMEKYKDKPFYHNLEKEIYLAVHTRSIFKELEYSRCIYLSNKFYFKKPENPNSLYYTGTNKIQRIHWVIAILAEYYKEK